LFLNRMNHFLISTKQEVEQADKARRLQNRN